VSKASAKFHAVMREFSEGELFTPEGKKVESRKQALAIAFSEARAEDPDFEQGGSGLLTGRKQ
jgi:hypothetical protein